MFGQENIQSAVALKWLVKENQCAASAFNYFRKDTQCTVTYGKSTGFGVFNHKSMSSSLYLYAAAGHCMMTASWEGPQHRWVGWETHGNASWTCWRNTSPRGGVGVVCLLFCPLPGTSVLTHAPLPLSLFSSTSSSSHRSMSPSLTLQLISPFRLLLPLFFAPTVIILLTRRALERSCQHQH